MRHYLLTLATLIAITTTASAQKYVGGDISMLPEYEKYGAKYYDKSGNDISGKLLEFFTEQGWNAARIRLFVDPSKASAEHQAEGVRQDLEFVKALGKRIKDAGMAFMLDFHYSDTWTDPGKHSTPSSWSSMTAAEIATQVYSYTKNCLQELKAAGAEPDFIQPGNEITYGMLWPTGHVYPNGGGQDGGTWDNFTNYLINAINACHEVCPNAKIIIQSEMHNASLVTAFFAQLAKYPAVQYDIIGLSYYPHYHGTLSTLVNTLNTLESKYPDKKIQIVETAYYHKWYPDDATYKVTTFPNWPATEGGQQQFTKDLIAALNQHASVDGLYWWFPEANEYGVDPNAPVTPSGWCNYSLFDNETGSVMNALFELKKFVDGSSDDDQPTDVTGMFQNMDFESCSVTDGTVTECPGWTMNYEQGWGSIWPVVVNQWHSSAVSGKCFQSWAGAGSSLSAGNIISQTADNLPAGTYTLTATIHSDCGDVQLFANNDTKAVTATSSWVTAYETTVTTTLSQPGSLTVGLKFSAKPATTGEINIYADNFKVTSQTTGIQNPLKTISGSDGAWYTLDGRRLTGKPTDKGLYIKDGRKVVLR